MTLSKSEKILFYKQYKKPYTPDWIYGLLVSELLFSPAVIAFALTSGYYPLAVLAILNNLSVLFSCTQAEPYSLLSQICYQIYAQIDKRSQIKSFKKQIENKDLDTEVSLVLYDQRVISTKAIYDQLPTAKAIGLLQESDGIPTDPNNRDIDRSPKD